MFYRAIYSLDISYTMEDDGLLKKKTDRKKSTLTDEKRAQIATRMREMNDKRILEAAKKIMNTVKPAEPPAPVIETKPIESPEQPKPEQPKPEQPTLEKPKKKRIIQIVQLESDDDEDEPVELVMPKPKNSTKKEGVRGNVVPPPEPEPEKPKETPKPKPKQKPKPKPKTVEPPKPVLPPPVRCKFL